MGKHLPKYLKTAHNTRTARTCRVYIRMVYSLQFEYIRENGVFDAFRAPCALSTCLVVYYIIVAKICVQKRLFREAQRQRFIFINLCAFFCFSSLVLSISLHSFFLSFLTYLLTYLPTYLLTLLLTFSNNNNNNNI